MHTCSQITQVGEHILNVVKSMVRSRQYSAVCDKLSMGSNISVSKSGPSEAFDGLNKQCRNEFLQRAGMPQSIRFHVYAIIIVLCISIDNRNIRTRSLRNTHSQETQRLS
jgi:hypothetical protein